MPSLLSTRSKKTRLGVLVATLIFGLGLGWGLNHYWGDAATRGQDEILSDSKSINLDLFWDVWDILQSEYIETEDLIEETQIYGAISGMVDAVGDPYTVFMTPNENQEFQSSLNGELQGIGAELTVEDGQLVVVSPLKDSPAEEAGLLPGDHIYLVDGQPTSEMSLWEAIMNIRGEEGTQVVLTVLREGEDSPIEISITRAEIVVPSVEYSTETVDDATIAHLAVYQFGEETISEFRKAVRQMTLDNVDGLILDLRRNGGGYLDASVEMLSAFFEEEVKGVIVKYRGDDATINEVLYTDGKGKITELPLVVLIDEGSASAAEIVAGALQDYDRAIIMGEQSFGKGSVQELVTLSDGSSLRLTVAKWFTPNETNIDEVGITPDIVVEMATEQLDTEEDTQYQAALDYLAEL